MTITSPANKYEVGKQVAANAASRLYLCTQEGIGRKCLLQIASDVEGNGALDRSAFILGRLASRAEELEAEYAAHVRDPNKSLGYAYGFTQLVESFVSEEQDGRRINILAFRNVDEPSKMVPIANIIDKDGLRADLRTSAWIMGKILKMLAFTQSSGIAIGQADATSILLETDEHYVVLFDFSEAKIHDDTVPREIRAKEIAQATQAVIALIGGDHETGMFPDDVVAIEKFKPYVELLLDLASGDQGDAHNAHREFYSLVDTLWERGFYPATFLKR